MFDQPLQCRRDPWADVSPSSDAQLGARTAGVTLVEQLTLALARAVDENEHRSRLMALAGHDLKQPLQVISMLLEVLALQVGNAGEKPRLELVRQSIRRIAEGLDCLALASRTTLDLDTPRQTAFPITHILTAIEPTWREHAAQKQVRFSIVPSAVFVHSDIAMLTTILDNLVGNAIKYARGGRVLIGCRHSKDFVSIQVLDNGVGIRAERLQEIFRAFHQEDTASTGLGLGLSIVRRTAAMLGHRIRVDSQVGKGSVFSIEVPIAAAPAGRDSMQTEQVACISVPRRPARSSVPKHSNAIALQE